MDIFFLWFQFEEGVLEVCFSLLRKSHGYKVGPHMSNPVTMARAISAIVSYMQGQRERKSESSLLYKVVQNVKKDASFRFMYTCITKHNILSNIKISRFLCLVMGLWYYEIKKYKADAFLKTTFRWIPMMMMECWWGTGLGTTPMEPRPLPG